MNGLQYNAQRPGASTADMGAYANGLDTQLKGLQVYSQAWMELRRTMDQVEGEIAARARQTTQTMDQGWQQVVQRMADGLRGVLDRAFGDLLTRGFKSFWKDIVKGFDDMLRQMAAHWLQQQAMMGLAKAPRGARPPDRPCS